MCGLLAYLSTDADRVEALRDQGAALVAGAAGDFLRRSQRSWIVTVDTVEINVPRSHCA